MPLRLTTSFLLVTLFAGHALASDDERKYIDLQPDDEHACNLSNGFITSPTLSLMTSAFKDTSLDQFATLATISKVIEAGCPIDEPDAAGLPPLHAAIMYDLPELVELYLNMGADPKVRIQAPGRPIDQLDAYAFAELMAADSKGETRIKEIIALLARHTAAKRP